jgi:hypothetical protein
MIDIINNKNRNINNNMTKINNNNSNKIIIEGGKKNNSLTSRLLPPARKINNINNLFNKEDIKYIDNDKIFNYKNNNYYIFYFGKMKHPITREWLKSIIYKKIIKYDINLCFIFDDEFYIREREDFDKKFKPGLIVE